jgi:hypothetical protein
MKKKITVNDKMQKGYSYYLVAPTGRNFAPNFKPDLSPKEMLALGVFGGRYLRDCRREFPLTWFTRAKFLPIGQPGHNPKLNFFGVDASQPLAVWRAKGWINEEHDPRGWFQWYCRYYLGRRLPAEDEKQIKRWRAMSRHVAQVRKNCRLGDRNCRRKQKQALLHWAYDSRKF